MKRPTLAIWITALVPGICPPHLRFEYKDEARAFAASLGRNEYQSGWIVADFSQAPLSEHYREVVREEVEKTTRFSND